MRQLQKAFFVTFLACPKKGDPKKGTPATILVRSARSSSVRFENSPFGQVKLSGLEQFETLHPRTRSQPGNGRMGTSEQQENYRLRFAALRRA